MMFKYIKIIGIIFLINLFSCKKSVNEQQISPAFYYWKTVVSFSANEKKYLNTTKKIYIKFFDIDIQTGKIIPKASVIFKTMPTQEIIPVVFITNRTLYKLSATEIEKLAENIALKMNGLLAKNKITCQEIQVDCDWTETTKNTYFAVLISLKKQFSTKILSATIRLHQVKFRHITGIPPVNKGMLMCYNMDDWKKEITENSIFSQKILQKYADKITEYPLPLDVAMPLFRWTIIYRNHHFMAFINQLSRQKLLTLSYLKEREKNIFEVIKDTTTLNVSWHRGDVLRTESVDFEQLNTGTTYVLNRIQNKQITLAYYHLDSLLLTTYSDAQLKTLLSKTP